MLAACSGSGETDDGPPDIGGVNGGINGPAVVDPSFDPFATTSPTETESGG
jgi:hypothetical protein